MTAWVLRNRMTKCKKNLWFRALGPVKAHETQKFAGPDRSRIQIKRAFYEAGSVPFLFEQIL